MDLGKLLGALDGDEIKDALELVRENRGLFEQLGKLPELFASFADGLDSAADQARAAGVALVGPQGGDQRDGGVRGNLLQVAESMGGLAGSTVGTALTKLGDHFAESGGEARGFLHP